MARAGRRPSCRVIRDKIPWKRDKTPSFLSLALFLSQAQKVKSLSPLADRAAGKS